MHWSKYFTTSNAVPTPPTSHFTHYFLTEKKTKDRICLKKDSCQKVLWPHTVLKCSADLFVICICMQYTSCVERSILLKVCGFLLIQMNEYEKKPNLRVQGADPSTHHKRWNRKTSPLFIKKTPTNKIDYELFNRSNVRIHLRSWNYRGCWHQTFPPHCIQKVKLNLLHSNKPANKITGFCYGSSPPPSFLIGQISRLLPSLEIFAVSQAYSPASHPNAPSSINTKQVLYTCFKLIDQNLLLCADIASPKEKQTQCKSRSEWLSWFIQKGVKMPFLFN